MRVGQMCVEQVFLYMMLKFTHNDVWSPLPRNCSAGYAGSVGRRRIEKSIHHRDSAPPQIFQTSWTISGAKHGVQGVRSCASTTDVNFRGLKRSTQMKVRSLPAAFIGLIFLTGLQPLSCSRISPAS